MVGRCRLRFGRGRVLGGAVRILWVSSSSATARVELTDGALHDTKSLKCRRERVSFFFFADTSELFEEGAERLESLGALLRELEGLELRDESAVHNGCFSSKVDVTRTPINVWL